MKLQSEYNSEGLIRLQDDRFADASKPDWAVWQAMDTNEVSVDDESQPEADLTESDPETDSLVAHYFGDVRQFELLNRAEEDALWQHIEGLKKRARRALYTSPVCLPTLQNLWQEVVQGWCQDTFAKVSSNRSLT
ncbi:hypothetical protein [Candidatus Entotheonella palauensis]|uniref:hypothetical protein n=1 Tax=Candidatus Entotheonella palauensis TaxID=93172 RepID=UPI000B7D4046|nr:hypothetical protein [Candidatus Entotheonella palauensis]